MKNKGFATYSLHERGFAHILVLIIVVIGIGLVGYFSWQKGLIKTVRNDTALPAPTVSTKDWKVYKEEKFAGFEFSYPDNWFFESDPVTSYSKLSTSPMDKFVYGKLPTGNAVLIIDIGYRNKEITIEDWCHFHPNFKSVKEFSTTYPEINGINALRIKYAWEDKNIEGEHICLPLNNINQNSETVIDLDFYYYKNDPRKDYYLQTFDQILSTFKFLNENSLNDRPPKTNQDGVDLKNISYTLPNEWEAKLDDKVLFISPINKGGYLFIKVYDYSEKTGRREFYCQITKKCIDATYFSEFQIGNISGYKANALDNSGGGAEYFGSKGNKFYIISSYNPPSPNEFENNYKNVLDSLIF